MLKEAVKVEEKKPTTLILDGAQSFHEAWKGEWEAKNLLHKDTGHIRRIHMENDRNNEMKRLSGEIERKSRGL